MRTMKPKHVATPTNIRSFLDSLANFEFNYQNLKAMKSAGLTREDINAIVLARSYVRAKKREIAKSSQHKNHTAMRNPVFPSGKFSFR